MTPAELGLPHREPFVFVDHLTEIHPGVSACGIKRFNGDEAFFAGHFPGNPIVPGVILTEALAQVAGIAGMTESRTGGFLLSAIRSMKFPRAVRPGELIGLTAKVTTDFGTLVGFEVTAAVDGETVASGQVVLSRT